MNTRGLSRLAAVGAVATAVAAPTSLAAQRNLVQIDGKLVPPAQVSEVQLAAGHAPSVRLVQISGQLVEPSQLSTWQGRAESVNTTLTGDSSSGVDTATVAVAAALGGSVLLAASALAFRRRRGLAPA
jgi:hypothetical protein